MSLEFVIIPISSSDENIANQLMNNIKTNVERSIDIEMDKNYNVSLNSRILKYRKMEKHVITVDKDYSKTNKIVIRFSDKGSKPHSMYVDDFIELIATLEFDSDSDDEDVDRVKDAKPVENKQEDNKQEENKQEEEGTCNLM